MEKYLIPLPIIYILTFVIGLYSARKFIQHRDLFTFFIAYCMFYATILYYILDINPDLPDAIRFQLNRLNLIQVYIIIFIQLLKDRDRHG